MATATKKLTVNTPTVRTGAVSAAVPVVKKPVAEPVAYYEASAQNRLLNNPTKYAEGATINIAGTNYVSQGGKLVAPTTRTVMPTTPVIAAPTIAPVITPVVDPLADLTPEGKARALIDSGMQDTSKLGEEFGVNMPSSMQKAWEENKSKQEAQLKYAQDQKDRADALAASTLKQNTAAAEANVAGTKATLAQGAEGVTSASKPQAVSEYETYANTQIRDMNTRYDSAKAEREQAISNLKDAQQSDQRDLIKTYQAQIVGAEQKMKQLENESGDIKYKTASLALAADKSAADVAKIKSETLQNNFTAMGEGAANLDISTLTKMATDAGLSYGQVVAMRDMGVLTAQLGKAKTQGEVDRITADITKLKKETEQVGKPAQVQEYEFFKNLDEAGQQKFLDLKRADPRLQFMKMDDGSVVSFNPTTGKGSVAFSPEEMNGQGVTMDMIGRGKVSGYDYGSTSMIKSDNQLLADGRYGHPGIDIGGSVGDAIPATVSGTVTFAGNNGGYGNQVVISNANGQYFFSHLSGISVVKDQEINAGDVLGAMGGEPEAKGSGNSTGPHLDYRVKNANGQWIDPKTTFGAGKTIPGYTDIVNNAKRLVTSVVGKKDVEDSIKDYVKGGNIKGLQDYVTGLAFDNLGEAEKTKRINRTNLVARGDELLKMMDEYTGNGGDLGIFNGTYTEVNNKIGRLPNQKAQDIANFMLLNLEDFARAQTGAAIAKDESTTFKSILPSIFDGKDLASSKIQSFAKINEIDTRSIIKQKLGETAYNSLFAVPKKEEPINYDELWKDSLPGGKHFTPSSNVMDDVNSVYNQ